MIVLGNIILSVLSFIGETYQDLPPWANWLPLVGIGFIYSGYALGFASVTFMLQGELLPARSRAFGSGLLGFLDNIVLFVVTKTLPALIAALGLQGAFAISAAFCVSLLASMWFVMPETSSLSLEDIEVFYKDKFRRQTDGK